MKPDFIVIGAARSGTTSLYKHLDEHPNVFMSSIKELNFFSNEKYWNKGFTWYESNFSKASKNQIIGEISPSYTKAPFTEDVVKRIADYAPHIKLIYIVRNPIDRFLSHYLHYIHVGYENRPISDVIKSLDTTSYAAQSLYYFQLTKYLERFNRDQILVLSFDDLKKNSDATIKSIYGFVGVDQNFKASETEKVHNANKNVYLKSSFGISILNFYHTYVEQRNIPHLFKRMFFKIANIGGTPVSKPKLSADEYQILKDYYVSDSKHLTNEFGIETSHWFEEKI